MRERLPSPMEVTVFCPGCGVPQDLGPAEGAKTCEGCSQAVPFKVGEATGPVDNCPVCGFDKLYARKDFPRRLGCLIVAIGAALSYPTHFISLAAVLVLEAIVYPFVPFVTACYRCGSQIRGLARNRAHGSFVHKTALEHEKWKPT